MAKNNYKSWEDSNHQTYNKCNTDIRINWVLLFHIKEDAKLYFFKRRIVVEQLEDFEMDIKTGWHFSYVNSAHQRNGKMANYL